MARLQADIATDKGSRYLQQLCKHWSHRFQVEFDPNHGVVHMTGADCAFQATPERLVLTLAGDDAATLARLSGVVTEHLQRFSFREALEVRWVDDAAA